MNSEEISSIPGMGMRIETGGKPIELYKILHHQNLPGELPEGYCFFGGTARTIALKYLGERALPPRDIDVIGISDFKCQASPDIRDRLSKHYMMDDYRHGHGVEIDSLAHYFLTRDFTVNQLLVCGDTLYLTRDAAIDLRRKIVRPSNNSYYDWSDNYEGKPGVHPKLVVRAIRLAEEFKQAYDNGKIAGIDSWQFEASSIPVFWIALGLERSYQRGDQMAMRFYLALLRNGTISNANKNNNSSTLAADSPANLAVAVRFQMFEQGREPFNFSRNDLNKNNPPDNNILDEIYQKYANLANAYTGKGSKDLPEY